MRTVVVYAAAALGGAFVVLKLFPVGSGVLDSFPGVEQMKRDVATRVAAGVALGLYLVV